MAEREKETQRRERNSKRNMPLWITAGIMLEKIIVEEWKPHFYITEVEKQATIGLRVCSEETVITITPEEDRAEIDKLFISAKVKMLREIGFDLKEWLNYPVDKNTMQLMTMELNNKIATYEAEKGVQVRREFLQMILYSEWEMPCNLK